MTKTRPKAKRGRPPAGRPRAAVQAAFLAAFEESVSIDQAAKAAGVARQTHYDWLRDDPTYRERFEGLFDAIADRLEHTAIRRALAEDPEQRSDRVLLRMLEAFRPARYRQALDVTTSQPAVQQVIRLPFEPVLLPPGKPRTNQAPQLTGA